jgi:NAD(P)-dependent dehydrogenase (short-subunit alcohol dehydrogenase family)
MKTLLTGGAGYIGSHTAVAMLEAGHEVAVVDNYYNSSPEAIRRVEQITGKSVTLYEADAADKEKMREVLKAEMPDCIIHFAGLKAVGESVAKPTEYYRNNIDTTLTLLEVMKELGEDTSDIKLLSCAGGDECKKAMMLLRAGKLNVDFVEGMICPGGCVGGPSKHRTEAEILKARSELLQRADKRSILENLKKYPMDQFSMLRDGSMPKHTPFDRK